MSANPTGPLHVGHGRQAALGDAIASLLECDRLERLARVLLQRRRRADRESHAERAGAHRGASHGRRSTIPEGGYHGEYIREIAATYVEAHPDDPDGRDDDSVRRFAVAELRKEQDLDLQAFGVKFDHYFLESSLYTDGKVDSTVERARRVRPHVRAGRRAVPPHDGVRRRQGPRDARSAERGGDYTYFLPDVAYHVDKWGRGFRRAINVQGADHHSTVTRVRAGLQAFGMGIPPGYPEYVLHQMVTVMREGQEVKFSKRAGDIVTVRDLVDWVGRDAVRYFYLMRKRESQLALRRRPRAHAVGRESDLPDPDGARAHVRHLPVRAGSMPTSIDASTRGPRGARHDGGARAVEEAGRLPALVAGAAEALEPHRVATYLLETAGLAHMWYHEHHVLDQPEPIAHGASGARARDADRAAQRVRHPRDHRAGANVN